MLSCPALSPLLRGPPTAAGGCVRLLRLPVWRPRCHKRQVSLLNGPIPHVSVLGPLIIVRLLLRMLLASSMLLLRLHSRRSMASSLASFTIRALGSAVQPTVRSSASGRDPLQATALHTSSHIPCMHVQCLSELVCQRLGPHERPRCWSRFRVPSTPGSGFPACAVHVAPEGCARGHY